MGPVAAGTAVAVFVAVAAGGPSARPTTGVDIEPVLEKKAP